MKDEGESTLMTEANAMQRIVVVDDDPTRTALISGGVFKPARMAELLQTIERAMRLTSEPRLRRRLELAGVELAE